jgi:adenylate cyclase
MNPNEPRIVAQRGELLTWLGRAEEGVEWVERAIRLDPLGAPGRAHLLGRAYYGAARYNDAAQAYRTMPSPNCGQRAELAAGLKQAGLNDEADAAVAENTARLRRVFGRRARRAKALCATGRP